MVGEVRRRTFLFVVGGLVLIVAAAAVIVVVLAVEPASAYKGKAPVRILSATLERLGDGSCYVRVTWDKKAGHPRYYMLEVESAATPGAGGGVVGGAISLTEPRKLTSAQVREGELTIGPLSSAAVAACRVALAPGLDGKKGDWVWSDFLR